MSSRIWSPDFPWLCLMWILLGLIVRLNLPRHPCFLAEGTNRRLSSNQDACLPVNCLAASWLICRGQLHTLKSILTPRKSTTSLNQGFLGFQNGLTHVLPKSVNPHQGWLDAFLRHPINPQLSTESVETSWARFSLCGNQQQNQSQQHHDFS